MSPTRTFTPNVELSEKDWDVFLFGSQKGLATQVGWKLRYHTLRSKGSTSGFPDRVLIRERLIVAELKAERGQPTDEQRAWLDGFAAAGVETYLWKPSDLDEVARILGGRWEAAARGPDSSPTGLWTPRDGYWQPRSMWRPRQGRRDTTDNQQQTLQLEGGTAA